MTGIRSATGMIGLAAPLAALLLWSGPSHGAPVRTGEAACGVAKARVAAHYRRAPSSIPGCETIRTVDSPRGFYVLALRGRCREPVCGSTLIGWYAVHKRTGRVFEWDVAELRVGARIG